MAEVVAPTGSNASRDPVSEGVPVLYAGLVTRGVALGLDVAAIIAVASLTVALVDQVASAFGHHGGFGVVGAVIGVVLYVIWVVTYFAGFWTLAGQTPGDRVLGIRVVRPTGELISARIATLRVAATALAALPLGLGFVPVLFSDRRRGLNDMIAGTVVVWVHSQTEDDPRPESIPVDD